MCFIPPLQSILTFDLLAVRLWSFRKQVRVHHWQEAENHIRTQKILRIAYIENVDCVLVFFQRKLSESKEKRFGLQLWQPGRLALLGEASLDFLPVFKFAFTRSYNKLLFLDTDNNVHVLTVTLESSEAGPVHTAMFSRPSSSR
jgi:hypothetical protein